MANNQTYIKLEIDPADYEKVKQQFRDIYDIADKAALRVQVAVQQSVHLTDGGLGDFEGDGITAIGK